MARTLRTRRSPALPLLEPLEARVLLSVSVIDDAKGGGKPGPTTGPAIRLDWVALHEFGHALGLEHSDNTASIMYPYYNANYNFDDFASDSEVTKFQGFLSTAASFAWKDNLDRTPGDGKITITYSWILDGARMDAGGQSNTFATFGALGTPKTDDVMDIVEAALQKWAGVSNNKVQFVTFDGDGIENGIYNFNIPGAVQNDSRFGDIRIGFHKFDGAGKTLAHTYYPPPNGGTAAGDAHFDFAENWVTDGAWVSTTTSSSPAITSSSPSNAAASAAINTPAAVVNQKPADAGVPAIVASNFASRAESAPAGDTLVLIDSGLRAVLS